MRRLGFILVWLAFLNAASAAHTTVRLLLSHATARAGETVWAGLQLRMEPGWHTYWRNAGDSGAPTTVSWKLPAGVTAGELLWPVPETDTSGGLTTYVYHDEAVLLVPLKIAPTAAPGRVDLSADLRWLECEKVCVPGRGSISGQLVIGSESKASADAPSIEKARGKLPPVKPADFARAWWEGPATGDKRRIVLDWPVQAAGAKPDFFPFAAEAFAVSPSTDALPTDAGRFRLRAIVEKLSGDWPKSVAGLLVERAGGLTGAVEAMLTVADAAPTAVAPSGATNGGITSVAVSTTGADSNAARPPAPFGLGLLLANLGFAFVGGLILNLMPCVLPVIALKIFGFVNQAQESPGRVKQLGLIYAAGVVTCFLILAGFVIGGRLVSWGAQFGDPRFVIAMTALVSLIGMNFFGVFEISLGGRAMGTAATVAGREGASGAFFNGVLAVILGTSCSAPFLAGAVGYAFFQPPLVIVLIFVSVGFGLAAPYVVLSFRPGWLTYLPKPGPWMERLKVAMGFPMLATSAWMLSLVGRHHGARGVLWVGVFVVVLAFAAWVFGEFYQRGRSKQRVALGLSLGIAAAAYVLILERQLDWRIKPAPQVEYAAVTKAGEISWKPWSHDAVNAARAAGKIVFVDFTADWCFNCQLNKKTSIDIDSVKKRLNELGVVTLLGDYTLTPDDITEELARFQRNAVPLVLVYPKDPAQPPLVLPPLLTPTIVLDALDKAAR